MRLWDIVGPHEVSSAMTEEGPDEGARLRALSAFYKRPIKILLAGRGTDRELQERALGFIAALGVIDKIMDEKNLNLVPKESIVGLCDPEKPHKLKRP